MSSFQIVTGGTPFDCFIKPYPKLSPTTNGRPWTGIVWQPLSNGGVFGVDRYKVVRESEVTFLGTRDQIMGASGLASVLETYRAGAVIGNIQTPLWDPLVDYSGNINVTIIPKPGQQVYMTTAGDNGWYELTATIRAENPTLLSVSPDLSFLRLQARYQADKNFLETVMYSQDRATVTYINPLAEAGKFGKAQFLQTEEEVRGIIQYLTIYNRVTPFAFPSLPQVYYPFGPTQPPVGDAACNCVATSFEIQRKSLSMWLVTIEFSQTF